MKKTSDLCDACAEIVVCKTPLRSFGQIRSFSGEIKTVQCDGDITKMREAVNLPGRGMVLVVDNAGILEHAVFGDVMAGLAIQNEWAGLIIYGAIRDVAIIDALPIGVKALGAIPCRGSRLGIGKANGGCTKFCVNGLIMGENPLQRRNYDRRSKTSSTKRINR